MGDHNSSITNDDINGQTLKCNTSIASMFTCKEFLKKVLERIRENKELRKYFMSDTADNYTVITMPMALKDFSILTEDIKTSVVKVRDNYSRIRAEQECQRYARSCYKEGDPFFSSDFYKQFVNLVTIDFSNTEKTVNLVSQNSLFKTNTRMVNLLLNKKIDGRDNIQRRRKVKEVITTVDDETGEELTEYVYYSKEDIEIGEAALRLEHSVTKPEFLDIDYREFTIEQFMMTIFASITLDVKSHVDASKYSLPIDNIFSMSGDQEQSTKVLCEAMNVLGKHDSEILKIIDEKGSNICKIVNNDIISNPVVLRKSEISGIDIYNCLLKHCRFIFPLVEYFYDFINAYKSTHVQMSQLNKIFGIGNFYVIDKDEDGEDVTSPLGDFERFFTLPENPDELKELRENAAQFNFLFNNTPSLFRSLFIGILKFIFGNTSNTATMMINFVANHIGLNSKTNSFTDLIKNYYDNVVGTTRPAEIIFDHSIITGFLTDKNKSESIFSYIYRNAPYYMNSDNRFTLNLSVIIDAFEKKTNINSRGTQQFSTAGTNFLFNTENLMTTITRMTGKDSNMAIEPFVTYTKINQANLKSYNDKNEVLNTIITSTYGEAFSRPIISLPPIPFSRDELEWLAIKCLDLRAKIEEITCQYSEEIPFSDYHDVFHELKMVQNQYAESDIDDPKFTKRIEELKADIARFYEICRIKEVPDSVLNNINNLELSLFTYTNHHLIKFDYQKFSLKFKNGIGNELKYHIGKNLILDENRNLKTCLQIFNDSRDRGIKYLENHFRPFFSEFATINTSKFNLSIKHEELDSKHLKDGKPVKYDELVMIVTYGDSDDTHMATKFRTKFTSFSNSDELMYYAFEKYKSDNDNQLLSRAEFDISDMSLDFTIAWFRSKEQKAAISGDKDEVKMKIYNEACGCIEQYPFYDALGKRIISRIFNLTRNSYDAIIQREIQRVKQREDREKNRNKVNKPTFSMDDFDKGIVIDSEQSRLIKEQSYDYWTKGVKTIVGGMSINDAMKSMEDKTKKIEEKSQRRQFRQNEDKRSTHTVTRTQELKYISKPQKTTQSADGWVTYNGKSVRCERKIVVSDSIPSGKSVRTPERFNGPLRNKESKYRQRNQHGRGRIEDRRSSERKPREDRRSSERKSGSSKFGTPTGSSKFGTPTSSFNRSERQYTRNSASPSVNKHGFTKRANSPSVDSVHGTSSGTASPNYLENRIISTSSGIKTPGTDEKISVFRNTGIKSPVTIQVPNAFGTPIRGNNSGFEILSQDDDDEPIRIISGIESPHTLRDEDTEDNKKHVVVIDDDDFEV